MPVISKQKFYVDAKLGEVERVIKYSSKIAQFYAELPPQVQERLMLTNPEVKASTEGECGRLWEQKIKEYNEAKREVSTVILFLVKLNGVVPPEDKPDYHVADYNADLFRLYKKDIAPFNVSLLGMTIQWGVYTKEFYKEKTDYKFNRNLSKRANGFDDSLGQWKDNIGKTIKEIPYTEERAAWFEGLQTSFEEMLIKVQEKLYNLTSEELLLKIDTGNFKLLGN
jgi:hypothetical protein